jgi:hypothetical protein
MLVFWKKRARKMKHYLSATACLRQSVIVETVGMMEMSSAIRI